MKRTPRLSRSGIEYGDYAWNFASGCGNNIDGRCKSGGFKCWAYSISQRFEGHYPNGFKPTIYPEAFCSPLYLKKPSRILCAFMGDLFWDCPEFDPDRKIHSVMPSGKASITMSLKGWIYATMKQCPQHTFLFKTKCPWNLPKWGIFPTNCHVGVTATDDDMFYEACYQLKKVEAKVKYISFEPLLKFGRKPDVLTWSQWIHDWLLIAGIKWIIIGAMTGKKRDIMEMAKRYPELAPMLYGGKWTLQPKIEWVQEIVRACDKAGIPVFLKDNLWPLFDGSHYSVPVWAFDKDSRLKQELPVV